MKSKYSSTLKSIILIIDGILCIYSDSNYWKIRIIVSSPILPLDKLCFGFDKNPKAIEPICLEYRNQSSDIVSLLQDDTEYRNFLMTRVSNEQFKR